MGSECGQGQAVFAGFSFPFSSARKMLHRLVDYIVSRCPEPKIEADGRVRVDLQSPDRIRVAHRMENVSGRVLDRFRVVVDPLGGGLVVRRVLVVPRQAETVETAGGARVSRYWMQK